MRYTHLAAPGIVLSLLSGAVAGSPPVDTPSGNVPGGQGPPFVQGEPLWLTVGITAAVVLIVIGVMYVVYRRYVREDRSPVTVQTDEEQVLALFDTVESDLKQADVREETGWSAAKVSRVTDRLEESGEIKKLRLGRENVLRRTE